MELLLTDLLHQISHARAVTDSLFEHVNPAAFYERPIPERHRIIFYLGHLEAFDWNQLKQCGMMAKSPNRAFDDLFAFGIDPEPGKLPVDTPAEWPSISEVHTYRDKLREIVDRELIHAPEHIIHMMIEHRHMHAETFSYILHNLAQSKKKGPLESAIPSLPVVHRLIPIPAGAATLGRTEEAGFGWDNEFREFQVPVPDFSIGRYKITNGEYLAFVREGGAAPHYWFQQDGAWMQRGMFHDFPLPLDWPVYATWEQAAAYAKWRGLALPTEAQYHRAAFGTPEGNENLLPWRAASLAGGLSPRFSSASLSGEEPTDNSLVAGLHNFNYHRWDPIPVNASPAGDSAFGIAQTMGNGWEWTSTLFAPFEGFQPRETYPGYSADFFDNQHYVMKGASPRTAGKLIRRSLRNWFRPEYPYVYATFRLTQN